MLSEAICVPRHVGLSEPGLEADESTLPIGKAFEPGRKGGTRMNAHSSVQQHFTSSTGGNATFSWHVASPPWEHSKAAHRRNVSHAHATKRSCRRTRPARY